MPYEPIIPEGQHLGASHDVDGAATGHLFEDGTNKLKGHAAWRWVDEPEVDYGSSYRAQSDYGSGDRPDPPRELTPEEIELAIELAGVIVAGIVRAAAVARPHLKRWWSSKGVPIGRSAWSKARSVGRKKRQIAGGRSSFAEEAMFVASAEGVEIAPTGADIRMSSAEWESRFRSMLSVGVFAQEQMRVLSIARAEERKAAVQEPGASVELTPREFVERVKIMLEATPALLNEKTYAELMRAFKAGE
jgi:hypothetical protein